MPIRMLSHCLIPRQSEFGYSRRVAFTKTTSDINLVLAFHHRRQCIQHSMCFWQSEANQGISKLWYRFKGCGFRNTNKPYCVNTHTQKKNIDRDIGPPWKWIYCKYDLVWINHLKCNFWKGHYLSLKKRRNPKATSLKTDSRTNMIVKM